MTPNNIVSLLHEDIDRFREALTYTEARVGFTARLIEKDYYCSLILQDLAPLFDCGMVFKGGTCLSKVYQEFYRLSEDLDFSLGVALDATRADRRNRIAPVKQHLSGLCDRLRCLEAVTPLTAANRSTQYDSSY